MPGREPKGTNSSVFAPNRPAPTASAPLSTSPAGCSPNPFPFFWGITTRLVPLPVRPKKLGKSQKNRYININPHGFVFFSFCLFFCIRNSGLVSPLGPTRDRGVAEIISSKSRERGRFYQRKEKKTTVFHPKTSPAQIQAWRVPKWLVNGLLFNLYPKIPGNFGLRGTSSRWTAWRAAGIAHEGKLCVWANREINPS